MQDLQVSSTFTYTKKVSRRMVQSKSPSTKGTQTKGVWSTLLFAIRKKPGIPLARDGHRMYSTPRENRVLGEQNNT